MTTLRYGGSLVPWNASWTGESRYEVRPCRWAGGRRAMWSPHAPGVGKPVFAKPHFARQRRSIMEMRCTVCGEQTPADDRWWFKLGEFNEGWFMTAESPVHRTCAELALEHCPHLRGRAADLERFPAGYSVLFSIIGGKAVDRDFGVNVTVHQPVIGHLKLAWPASLAASHSADARPASPIRSGSAPSIGARSRRATGRFTTGPIAGPRAAPIAAPALQPAVTPSTPAIGSGAG